LCEPRAPTRCNANASAQSSLAASDANAYRREFKVAKAADHLAGRRRECNCTSRRGDRNPGQAWMNAQRFADARLLRDHSPSARPRRRIASASVPPCRTARHAADWTYEHGCSAGDGLAASERQAREQRPGRTIHTITCLPLGEHRTRQHRCGCREHSDDQQFDEREPTATRPLTPRPAATASLESLLHVASLPHRHVANLSGVRTRHHPPFGLVARECACGREWCID
jgi:hypothetical protein